MQTITLNSSADKLKGKYDQVVLDNMVSELDDIQAYFEKILKHCHSSTRLVIVRQNHPLSAFFTRGRNWIDEEDLDNLLKLAGFETIASGANKVVARPGQLVQKDYSVSIIVPAKNEEGNIKGLIAKIPRFGASQEIIFVEGGSIDNTWNEIKKETRRTDQIKTFAFKQKGKGKADAVRLGFKKAKGEMLMILDSDLTVNPKELVKFYNALSTGVGEFANGSRLVYPVKNEAMRTLNKIGNKFFSVVLTWILGQRFKDTLCGTKVLFKKDYEAMSKVKNFGRVDPFGDFDLIFGAIRKNLKVIEIPVRYRERKYGRSNINKFRNGLSLLKMTWLALLEFKFR